MIPIPEGPTPDEAAGILIAGSTALLMLTRQANLSAGESILIGGAGGGVGTYAIQIAKSLGAGTVVGAASTTAKRDAALAAGADHVVDPTARGWEQQARAHAGGDGVDVVLSGQVKVQVGETLPLAHAAEAHRRVEARATTGKVILKPWA